MFVHYRCCVVIEKGPIIIIALGNKSQKQPFNFYLFSDGLILIAMRKAYLEKVEEYIGRLEPLIEKLEQENKIDILDRRVVPNYSFGLDGLVLKLKVKSN